MKDIITFSLTLLAITLLLTFKIAIAGERVGADELAESGIIIDFQMTAEEMQLIRREIPDGLLLMWQTAIIYGK